MPIIFSDDGAHYAYVGAYSRTGSGIWSVVDGRQVNFFGDQLQYNARNVLISKLNLGNATGLLLNGKPETTLATVLAAAPAGKVN